MTTNGDRPRDGDHPRDDDHPNDHPYPPGSNPYPPGHSENHPGCPDHLYWLLIKDIRFRHYDDLCPAGGGREKSQTTASYGKC